MFRRFEYPVNEGLDPVVDIGATPVPLLSTSSRLHGVKVGCGVCVSFTVMDKATFLDLSVW